jgi:CubicO group peptidase (beta-lactamase class C family)
MKHYQLTLFFLFLCVQVLMAQKNVKSVEKDRFAGLDTTFARVLKDHHAAGFAVAVVEKNKVVYAKGFGYRDFDKKIPVTPSTSFAIGSCTKAFTSSLIGLLQKDGKVEYDKPVTNYLGSLRFFNKDLEKNITLRDMMCHRTGLPRHDFSWYLNPTTRDSLLTRLAYLEPSVDIRQRWQYNNWMFFLQGYLTEKLTMKSWEENVKSKIFEPLGMKNSFFSVDDFSKQTEPAKGYEVKKDSIIKAMDYYNIDAMGPAGSINSSVLDMAKWVQMWIKGGMYEGKEVLPSAYVSEAMSSQMVIGAGLPTKEYPDTYLSNYGFGWFLSSYKGHYRVEHGGNIDGFSASTSFFPSDSVGIVVLVNQNRSVVPSIVRNTIADRLLNVAYFDWNKDRLKVLLKAQKEAKEAEQKTESSRKKGTKPSHNTKDYAGLYTHSGYGKMMVSVKNDSLFFRSKYGTEWLAHYHYDVFQNFDTKNSIDTTERSNQRFQFNTNLQGEIESLSITGFEPTIDKPLIFNRQAPVKPMTVDELKRYVSEFTLSGTTIKTYLKNEKTLYVLVPGQPEYELASVDKHTFNFVSLNGFTLVFDMKNETELVSVLFKQPNGNFRALRKN